MTLTGYVPDNTIHAAIATSAARKFFTEKVVDNLKASVGAPGSFNTAVIAALGAVAAVDRHARGLRPRGEAVGRRAL